MTIWVQKAFMGRRGKRGEGESHARLGALTDKFAPVVKVDMLRGLQTFKDRVDPSDLEKALRTGGLEKLMRTIPFEDLSTHLDRGFAKASEAAGQAAQGAVNAMPQQVQAKMIFTAERFAKDDKRLQSFVSDRKGQIVAQTKDGTHEAVQRELSRARELKTTPSQMAENIRDSIGLNARQAQALSNYRAGLAKPMVDRESGKERKPPGIRQQETLATAYEDRLLDARAIMIARTETRFASNQGELDAWREASDQELLPAGAGRKWVVDGNPCVQLCIPMNGIVVGLDEMWTLPDGREVDNPTEAHPHCECVATLEMG